MPVPSSIADLSQTPNSNYPTGSESPITTDNYLREYAAYIAQLRDGKNFTDPVTLASATTTDIGAQNSMFVEITGTTTITGFGTTYNGPRFLKFTGILTLTHNATTLNLPGGANITTAAGDTAIVVPNSTPNGWDVVSFNRVSGASLVSNIVAAAAAGTADAITATFSPAITAWTNGLRFTLTGCSANTTTTPTVNPNSIGAKTIVNQGNLPLIIGDMPPQADLQYNSTYDAVVLLNPLEVTEAPVITTNDSSNARTFTLQPCVLMFRNATLTSGSVVKRRVPAAITFTFSSGSTAGAVNAVQCDIAAIAIDNAGTVELAANNLSGGVDLSEAGVISTTAEGGAGAADSATVVYSTTARTNVAYRVLSVIRSTQATAGTWVTAPKLIQSVFGQAFASMRSLGFGQTWQGVSGSRVSGTTYYNTTGRPIQVAVVAQNFLGSTTVNGIVVANTGTANSPSAYFIVPPGASYVVTINGSTVVWAELR